MQTELNSVTVAATNKNCYDASGKARAGTGDYLGGDDIEGGRILVDLQSSVPSETYQRVNESKNLPGIGRLGSDPAATEMASATDNKSILFHSVKATPRKQPQQMSTTPEHISSGKKGRMLSQS